MNKRAEQKQATLERLRESIDHLVAEKGFDQITIREISQKAGISVGMFYYHFTSKEEILFDRYLRAGARHKALYEEVLKDMPPVEALAALIHHCVEFSVSRIPQVALPYHKAILSEYPRWSARQPDELIRMMTTLFEKAVEMGAIASPFTPGQLSQMLWSMQMGMRVALLMQGQDFVEKYQVEEQLVAWLMSLTRKAAK